MVTDSLKDFLCKNFPDTIIDESFGVSQLRLQREQLICACELLKNNSLFGFNMLVCQTAVDRLTSFEIIYHLRCISKGFELIINISIPKEDELMVPTVYDYWSAAELFEDEIYDMFGIKFENHPNLRRIMMDDDFVGYPLRKDFLNSQEL